MAKYEIYGIKIEVVQLSKKGAALIEFDGKKCWFKPSQLAKLEEGKITPSMTKAMHEAVSVDEKMTNKKPFHLCKCASAQQVSDKATVIKSFDGSEDIFPTSQIIQVAEGFLIPAWLVELKTIQVSAKIQWV